LSNVEINSRNGIQKPVIMLISLFNIPNALADGDYIMMMILLMTLYNMGGGEWKYLCTLLHTEYASIGIY
jgi:hypothetical protein